MAETGEKLFKKYAKLTKFLVEICDVAKGVDEEINTQDYLLNFDLLLQALLFYQLKSNKVVCPKELTFINILADSADLLKTAKEQLINEGYANLDNVTWDNIMGSDKVVFKAIEDKIFDLAKEYTKKLVSNVALAECLEDKSYFSKLNDDTVDLLFYFAKLENGADENEVQQGILGYVKYVASYYIEVISNMEEIFADKKIKKDLLVSLRKEYKKSKRTKRLDFLDKYLKSIKDRLTNLFKKDKE